MMENLPADMVPEVATSFLPAADYIAIDLLMMTLLVCAAFAAIRARDLLVSAVLLGIFSLLMALTYLLLDAPDVALTEAAVGAGISTVLFLLALSFVPRREKSPRSAHSMQALFVVAIMGLTLCYAVEGLPSFGDPNAPIHQHVAPYYLEQTKNDIAIPNVVTAILASYRSYDTLGETAVIFTAGIGLCALLMNLAQIRPSTSVPKREKNARGKKRGKEARP